MSKVVSSLLEISELAHAYPDLKVDGGDDIFGDFTFLIKVIPCDQIELIDIQRSSSDGEEKKVTMTEKQVIADFFKRGTYGLDASLGQGFVERVHFKLIEELAKQEMKDGNFPAAEKLLFRELQISEDLSDDLYKIITLNNLGLIKYIQKDNLSSRTYLNHALTILDEIFLEDSFLVDLLVDEEGEDGQVVTSRSIGKIDVPLRFSEEFDKEPNIVVQKVSLLKRLAGNIHGNIASNDLEQELLSQAMEGYSRALQFHREIEDKENMSQDLKNLGIVAKALGDIPTACSYWRDCKDIYYELKRRDERRINANHWVSLIEELCTEMHRVGCNDQSVNI